MTALAIIVLIVLLGASLLIVLSGIALYSRLINLRAATNSLWSRLNVLLKERQELTHKAQLPEFEDDNVAAAIDDYNATVEDYNIAIDTFPAQILSRLFRLKKARFFDAKIS